MAAEQNIAQPTPVGSPVQVRPIEFITFGEYNLIVDARSPREFSEDHIPSAVNLPVLNNDEYAEIGTTHGADPHRAYVVGVAYALRNMAAAIDRLIAQYPRQSKMLVYCFRGGKRSKLWHDALTTIGYRVDRLQAAGARIAPGSGPSLRNCPLAFGTACYAGQRAVARPAYSRRYVKWAPKSWISKKSHGIADPC